MSIIEKGGIFWIAPIILIGKGDSQLDVHQLLGILGFSLVLWWMYKGFLKQPTSYNDYIDRATLYDAVLLNKNKAKDILKDALTLQSLSNIEKASINLEIGFIEFKQMEYESAVTYFDTAFELISQEKFLYNKKYIDVIKAYIYAHQKEKAIEIYNNLIARQSYDRRFGKLKKLESWF
ncbi:hypothetical protein BGM21_15110 [Geobacillus thermoleovorans]|nr:hypothetical protein BGM21_15110 [Geobacillus thermoleovorans]EQB96839.1 hypothetical protein GA8_03755 [Geobacillus sp. A8]